MQGSKSSNLQRSFYSLLHLSSDTSHLRQIHCQLHLLNLHQDQYLITNFINVLSRRFRGITYAISVFSQIQNPNTFLFNAMIQALSETPNFERHALLLYTLQLRDHHRPNRFTFPPLLKACVSTSTLVVTPIQQIHSHITKLGTCSDVYVGTTLIDSYSKCGHVEFARNVFEQMPLKNVVSWNSMLSGYTKCGEVNLARKLFDEMLEKNLVSWTSMISGYAQNGYFAEALEVFEGMCKAGIKPNEITLVGVISACANLGALSVGRKMHNFLQDNNYKMDLYVGSALIVMYSKCGMVEDALQVFHNMADRNVVSCSAMIIGLAMNGRASEAINIFEDMRFNGILPGDITFTGILCACSHAGLVVEGQFYFSCMTRDYSLVPRLQHYACMTDLLGRAGHLDQAYQFIKKMPIKPDVVVWGTLLGTSSKTDLEFKLGIYAARQILELDPKHSGSFVFLSYAYARVGDSHGMEWVRRRVGKLGTKRVPGRSWIELDNVVHQFYAGDKTHPQNERIYAKLDELAILLEVEGYNANVDNVFSDIEEEEKEQSINVHSEKLAVAFGLINTADGTLIRIVKNLRVCDDCHHFIKLISKIVKRDIVLRDNNRFHHFSAGSCSCQDYW